MVGSARAIAAGAASSGGGVLEAKGKAVKGRGVVQGLGEVWRLSDDLGAVSSLRSTTTMSRSATAGSISTSLDCETSSAQTARAHLGSAS